jgi:hypothetical protein
MPQRTEGIVSEAPPLVLSGTTRGSIWPQRRWQLPGGHSLELDCGSLGFGPMGARVDGVVTVTFPKPSRAEPCVLAPSFSVGGRLIEVYADSHNWGDLVGVDVFVDGTSLHNRALISSLEIRRAQTAAASAAYVSPLEPARFAGQAVSTALVVGVPFGIAGMVRYSTGHAPAETALWAAVFAGLTIAMAVVLRRQLRRLPASGSRRRIEALAISVMAFVGTIGLMCLILVGPLRPA